MECNNEFFVEGITLPAPILFKFHSAKKVSNIKIDFNTVDCNHSFVEDGKIQTRAGDEAETIIVHCIHCGIKKHLN